MSTIVFSLVILGALLLSLATGLWIALSLAFTGFVAMVFVHPAPGVFLAAALWESIDSWTLAALPMFIWMGEILFRTRLSAELFNGLSPWVRRVPGGLLHVNILACGIFGSVAGSSAATCATVSKIALPELQRRGYDRGTAIGSLATAGTLGILIPPSITMVIYAIAADVSIIRVFIAGFIPGLMVMLLFSGYIAVWALMNPDKQPALEPKLSLSAKLKQSVQLIPCIILVVATIGSMVVGWATATEAAAFGVAGSLVLAATTRSLTWSSFVESLYGATRLSCMVMFILGAAAFLTKALALAGVPIALATFVDSLHLGPIGLILVLTVIYVILGTALDGVSMIVLTTAIVVPLVQKAGFDLVWFGIFIVLLVEISEITPPVGFNLFVMQTMTGQEQTQVAKAALPFFFMLVIAIVLITLFPVTLVTGLPDMLLSRK